MRVLIADDSAVIRAMLEQNLRKEKDIEIVASVSNGRKAVDNAKILLPDLVISDIDMPEMDGLEATRIITGQLWIPVLIFSEDESALIRAKGAGAADFVVKPNLSSMDHSFFEPFIKKIRKSAGSVVMNIHHSTDTPAASHLSSCFKGKSNTFKILCIGASTGGPTAVQEVLSGLGDNFPLPVLYTQHIEVGADVKMAAWFNSTCKNIHVGLAKNGEEAYPGHVYMAPAEKHLIVDFVKTDGTPVIKLTSDPPVRFLRPAVDKLFLSASMTYGKLCLAALLTGMGRDGADGCKAITVAGGYTVVEDESTCAVFGMPAAAIEVGGASIVLPRNKIAQKLRQLAGNRGNE